MTRMRRLASALTGLALSVALVASSCSVGQHKCRGHGGVDHYARVGSSEFAVCGDGSWHSVP